MREDAAPALAGVETRSTVTREECLRLSVSLMHRSQEARYGHVCDEGIGMNAERTSRRWRGCTLVERQAKAVDRWLGIGCDADKTDSKQPAKAGSGFTLIELMVTLAVAAILVATAIPAYRSFIETNRLATRTNEFLAALDYARNEAITRGNIVRICKSDDGRGCSDSGDWQQGWLIFVDQDDDGTRDNGTGEPVLQVRGAFHGGTQVTGASQTTRDGIRFGGNGFAYGSQGAVRIATPQSRESTLVCIASTGRSRTQPGDGSCS